MHATKGNRDLWADLGVSFADDIDVRLLEVAPVRLKLTLKPPAAKPEPTPGEKDLCPFFTPLPGSTGPDTHPSETDFLVSSKEQPGEWQRVASGALIKQYPRADLSNALLLAVYRPALVAAGWTIHREVSGQENRDAYIEAHHTANGRGDLAGAYSGRHVERGRLLSTWRSESRPPCSPTHRAPTREPCRCRRRGR